MRALVCALAIAGCADAPPAFEFCVRVHSVPAGIDVALVDGIEAPVTSSRDLTVSRTYVSYLDATAAPPIEIVFNDDGTPVVGRAAPGVCASLCSTASSCIPIDVLEYEGITVAFGPFDVGDRYSFGCTGGGQGIGGSP